MSTSGRYLEARLADARVVVITLPAVLTRACIWASGLASAGIITLLVTAETGQSNGY